SMSSAHVQTDPQRLRGRRSGACRVERRVAHRAGERDTTSRRFTAGYVRTPPEGPTGIPQPPTPRPFRHGPFAMPGIRTNAGHFYGDADAAAHWRRGQIRPWMSCDCGGERSGAAWTGKTI